MVRVLAGSLECVSSLLACLFVTSLLVPGTNLRLGWPHPSHPCAGVPECLQQGINPNQALLMNSLRRLLAVSAQLEHRLTRWCGGIAVQSQSSFQPSAGKPCWLSSLLASCHTLPILAATRCWCRLP